MSGDNHIDMKDNFKIILFLCNWNPHAAFQILQDRKADIPLEIKMVRIPCSGRVTKALLLKAFEKGADGVVIIGCKPGSCRYGNGTDTAVKNTEDTRDIIDILGFKKQRMRFVSFHPDETDALLKFLKDFCEEIKSLGHTPVVRGNDEDTIPNDSETAESIVARHNVYACQDCGKCTSACPLALAGKPFSPRSIASAIIGGDLDNPAIIKDIWSCLTCEICYDRCPSAVSFPDFIRDMRHFYRKRDEETHEVHAGFFHTLMRTMASPNLKLKRWNWLPDDIRIDKTSKTLFFGGCARFFDIFFKEFLSTRTLDIIADSLRLLNFFDIQPAVMENERCCGHDLLWSGDRDNFIRLGQINAESFRAKGIEEIITACPECYRTLAFHYPSYGIDTGVKVTHLYELLEKEIDKGAVDFKKIDKHLTFQDSCRLNRSSDLASLPRKLISRIQSKEFKEMPNSGKSAICCGNSAWIGCDSFSKALQVKRIRQARGTGSDLLLTACPKCQIHLKCAMEDPFLGEELKMEMMDLTSLIAKTIKWE